MQAAPILKKAGYDLISNHVPRYLFNSKLDTGESGGQPPANGICADVRVQKKVPMIAMHK